MIALFAALSANAWACSLAPAIEHVVTENPSDVTAPSVPTVAAIEVVRGRGPVETENGSSVASSCDDIGFVHLTLSATDDVSAPEHLGYVLTLVEGGQLPEGLQLSTDGMAPVRVESDGTFTLSWGDGDIDEQDAFAFELDIAAMDEAGNLSDPFRVLIEDDGVLETGGGEEDAAGCATTTHGGWIAGILAAMAVRRRERRG